MKTVFSFSAIRSYPMLHYLITNREMIQAHRGAFYIEEDGLDTAGEPEEKLHFALFDSDTFNNGNSCRSSLQIIEPSAFYTGRPGGDVLFYIHGFRTDLKMVLQDICLLEEKYITPGGCIKMIIALSWPARKNYLYYTDDANDAISSGKTFARNFHLLIPFISSFKKEGHRIHLLAHSMGNRMLESLLQHLVSTNLLPSSPVFNEVILAAPDVDWQAFEKEYALHHLSYISHRVTVYYHSEDLALFLSQNSFNRHKRLGRHGFQNIDNVPANVFGVDCSSINDLETMLYRFIEHSYHQLSNSTIKDILQVLNGTLESDFIVQSLRECKSSHKRLFNLKIAAIINSEA